MRMTQHVNKSAISITTKNSTKHYDEEQAQHIHIKDAAKSQQYWSLIVSIKKVDLFFVRYQPQ
jgi:hypothetical protein